MKKNILYIGRFQPFHRGHSDAIDQISSQMKKNDTLYIGIGSAEENFTPSNPLTAGERMEIIEAVMKEKKIPAENFSIVPIRNINHYALWPVHVQQYLPKIDTLFSGSPLVRQLWKNSFPESEVQEIKKNNNISGTKTRKAIAKGENLTDKILSSTEKFLEKFSLQKRLLNMKTE